MDRAGAAWVGVSAAVMGVVGALFPDLSQLALAQVTVIFQTLLGVVAAVAAFAVAFGAPSTATYTSEEVLHSFAPAAAGVLSTAAALIWYGRRGAQ